MKKNRQKSLTKTLTIKLSLLLFAVLLILAVGSYVITYNFILQQVAEYNTSIAAIILDSACNKEPENGESVFQSYAKSVNDSGDYFCRNDYVNFTYAYIISNDTKHYMLLNISGGNTGRLFKFASEKPEWTELNFNPEEAELEVWQNKKSYATIWNHFFDNTIESICAQNDTFGNRIVVGAGLDLNIVNTRFINTLIPMIIVILAAFVVLTISIYFIIRRSVLKPINRLCDFMTAFIKDGQRSKKKLDTNDNYEFSLIASSFNKMADDIDSYINNIKQLNSSRERQEAELEIASQIQQGFLSPNQCFAKNCEIFAMMTAAKNVGGDLYDYLILDDGRVLVTIADVSGKGLAASLYMAITLVTMRQLALSGNSPAKILEETNNIICSHNENMFFITAFVGIYNPETGLFTYSNAGHNPPYILREKPEFLKNAQNLVLGLYKNETYTEDKTALNYGDIIFLYTDGITEATDKNKKFFGEERLTSLLSDFRIQHAENIVEYINEAVCDYTMNAEQHDDMTMLSLTIKHIASLDLAPDTHEFTKIKQVIMDSQLPQSLRLSLCVAAEEIFINICSYAFEGKANDDNKQIKFVFEHSDRIVMHFEDNGTEYDPTENVQMDIDYDPDTQMGGLGKIIAFTVADKINYKYTENKNCLTIIKYLI